LLVNWFLPLSIMCLNCEDIARQICAMVRRRRIFGEFLRPVFPASRVQHVSDLHSKFALRPHPCVEVWLTSNLRRRGKEIEERKKKPHDENIMACPISYGAITNQTRGTETVQTSAKAHFMILSVPTSVEANQYECPLTTFRISQ